MPTDGEMLAGIPLFEHLEENDRHAIAAAMQSFPVAEGEVIFRTGDPGDALYLVVNGRIGLWMTDHSGDRIDIETCAPGQLFGELSLLDGGARTASAEALEDSEVLTLGRDALLDFLGRNPRIAIGLLTSIARRIRRANELVRGRVIRNVNTEVGQELSFFDRVAAAITAFGGSMSFLLIHVIAFTAWIVLNVNLIPGLAAFDPFPFGLLTLAVSLEAIFLSVFVLLSQNLQMLTERVRSDVEYKINVKAELEVAHLHEKVDRLHEEVVSRLHRIDRHLGAG